jgi:peptide chain release factor 1
MDAFDEVLLEGTPQASEQLSVLNDSLRCALQKVLNKLYTNKYINKEQAMKVLKARLYEMEVRRKEEESGAERKSKIGTGDRAEKIRTYNYPQNRVTDHRIGYTTKNLDRVMNGELDDIIEALITEDQKRKLAGEE